MPNIIKIDNADLKRRKREKSKRQVKQIVCNILIVCEGTKTEPNYFEAFNKKQRGIIVYKINTKGIGQNTISIVEQAIKLRDEKPNHYDSVWAVFDKDDFDPTRFDNAINKARDRNIECAWSNEAFELWYLLHFRYQNTKMSRDKYKKAISDAVNSSPKYKSKNKYTYAKNDINNHTIMNTYGNQSNAIANADKLVANFNCSQYHSHNPCTLVYKLVQQLMGNDIDFNKIIENKITAP